MGKFKSIRNNLFEQSWDHEGNKGQREQYRSPLFIK